MLENPNDPKVRELLPLEVEHIPVRDQGFRRAVVTAYEHRYAMCGMPSPVTHITGLMYGLELPFIIQGKVVLQDVWDPDRALQLIVREGGTFTVGATPFLGEVVESAKDLGSERRTFKSFDCGGADIPPELIEEATRLLGHTTPVYGSTEHPTLTGYEEPVQKAAHTDRRLMEGSSAKIIDEAGDELPAGEVGEIAAKGLELFLGYLQPEHNEAAFIDDGYFLTGDLTVIDDEGYFKIMGRKKDIILRGGENISVKEVEDLLYGHPTISEVAIFTMPDVRMGEKGCAYVVPKEDQTFSLDEIKEFLMGEGIARQKLPERLEVVDEMSTTASGKIQKYVLREEIRRKVEAYR